MVFRFLINDLRFLPVVVYRLPVGHLEQKSFSFLRLYILFLLPQYFESALYHITGIFFMPGAFVCKPEQCIGPLLYAFIVAVNVHSIYKSVVVQISYSFLKNFFRLAGL